MTRMRKSCFFVVMLAALLIGTALPAAAKKMVPKVDNFILFQDYSGSMAMAYKGQAYVQFGGTSKIAMSKQVMTEMNKAIPELGYKGGVYTFAPYKEMAPMATYSKPAIEKGIKAVKTDYDIYARMTPMGIGLTDLDKVIGGLSGKTAVFILSDGDSNRGTDPVKVAKDLAAKYGDKICFHVISFADNKHGEEVLKAISLIGKCCGLVKGEELAKSKAAVEKLIECALYDWIDDEIIVFRSIYFDFNKYNIKKEFVPVLEEGVAIIKSKPDVLVICEGHTDSVGSVPYNQKLSERRANSVKAFFVKKGIDANRIQAVGFGKLNPRYDNKTAEGRRLNRRVEIKFKPKN
jgi:OmpA-OmpF porin, OOP family